MGSENVMVYRHADLALTSGTPSGNRQSARSCAEQSLKKIVEIGG